MKRNLYRAVCLFLGCLLTGYLFIHISYMHRGYTRLMGFYALENNTIDVVFIGTSVTFSAFMPMEAWEKYGYTSYNYCTNVQFEESMRYGLREVCKTQSPKLIVIDVMPFMYQHWAGFFDDPDTFIEYNLDSMKYSPERTALAIRINDTVDGDLGTLLNYLFDIRHNHGMTPDPMQWNNAVNDVARGYGYLKREGLSPIFMEDDGREEALGEPHESYFQELLAEADKLEAEVLFYCSPMHFTRNELYERKNYIKRIVEEAGYTFWDFSGETEELGLDIHQDFWSVDHLDSLGAEKVTNFLAPKLDEVYDLPDHRDDPAYASWHDDYEEWCELKKSYNAQDLGIE